MQGIHLTADLFQCACVRDLLVDRGVLQEACIRLVRGAGLTVVGDDFHQFANFEDQPGGVTGLVLLAESHLAVHTWPELNAVTLDVYVCNFKHDNTSKAQVLTDLLVALFVPERSNRNRVQRGVPGAPETPDEQHLALEWLTPDVVHGFAERRAPITTQSPLQRLDWHDTRA
ncbi:MAG TPA: adenosylmethionine decarboxylase, partial [Casimicrobium sp.]|nr:adenosylmethionine decarboxylase [Casimicrobium sp.]